MANKESANSYDFKEVDIDLLTDSYQSKSLKTTKLTKDVKNLSDSNLTDESGQYVFESSKLKGGFINKSCTQLSYVDITNSQSNIQSIINDFNESLDCCEHELDDEDDFNDYNENFFTSGYENRTSHDNQETCACDDVDFNDINYLNDIDFNNEILESNNNNKNEVNLNSKSVSQMKNIKSTKSDLTNNKLDEDEYDSQASTPNTREKQRTVKLPYQQNYNNYNNSPNLIHSTRSVSSSILSIEKLRNLKSKRRSASTNVTALTNATTKNIFNQILNKTHQTGE
jgi:hypothetical protein